MNILSRTFPKLRKGESLTYKESFALAEYLVHATIDVQIEIISLLKRKGETSDEILGFVKAFQKMHGLPTGYRLPHCLDMCGTGGDGLHTFNASTTAAFIASGAGVCLAKSGNRAVSSLCGSSDVLSSLGVSTAKTSNEAYEMYKKNGLVFIATSHFFPGFAKLTQARKEVGGLTIGNLVGPLLNPLGVSNRLLGVPSLSHAKVMAQVLQKLQAFGSLVVTGSNGEDEITTCGITSVFKVKKEGIVESQICPLDFEMPIACLKSIKGGSPSQNAGLIRRILEEEEGPKTNMAILNAAAVISMSFGISFKKAIKRAQKSIKVGSALHVLSNVNSSVARSTR